LKQALSKPIPGLAQQDRWNNTLKLQCVKGNIHRLMIWALFGFLSSEKTDMSLCILIFSTTGHIGRTFMSTHSMILGIETSCDETAAAVTSGGHTILSNVVWSQVAIHHPYGGVVPELASRKHMEKIVPVVKKALAVAGADSNSIDGVAVTCGPGLVGALLVGVSFAKAFAYARRLPLTGVNHLHGHIAAVYLEPDPPPFPFVALLASGGHTNLYYVAGPMEFEHMGQTRDDAAGEAFDKVAKILGLGYPGGMVIDQLSRQGDPDRIRFPRVFLDKTGFDFSFSGLKTAVARYLQGDKDWTKRIPDIAAGFQEAVVDVLVQKGVSAAQAKACQHLALVGGVASNRRLRERIKEEAQKPGIAVHIPGPGLCTDNAAMIAAMGYHQLCEGENSSPPAWPEPSRHLPDLPASARHWQAGAKPMADGRSRWLAGLDLDVYSKTSHSGRLGVVKKHK
jgi:N6-L-threonylcarbamoyladenine synthase